nr:D-2-hydroxyacid dehydrogenase [Virgibacillus natechei]
MENHPTQAFLFCNNMEEAKAYIKKAEILVTYGGDLTPELIGQAQKLKWIMVMSAGIDQMPFQAIEERGILVTNVKGIHKVPMAEYAISMLLQVYREAKVLSQSEKEHYWNSAARMQEITEKTILIAGAGSIGQEVARLAKAFRMKTIGVSKSGKPVDYFDENHTTTNLDKLLPESDIVVSVLPRTKETQGLFTYEQFSKLPNHAVFLNMGRGDVLIEGDLLKALQEKKIAHAILDVFEEEPLPEEHPFWQEESVTITPHISGVSRHYTRRGLEIFGENLQRFLEGKEQYVNKIDVTKGY